MCIACDEKKLETVLATGRRRRLWEINSGWHCSILGTCLTLSDLRALGRKLSLQVRANHPKDYQYHGFFVQEACKHERPAKLLNKLLDKRHAAAIRKAKDTKSVEELEELWQDAVEAGNIPGIYWAILSHPLEACALCDRMFAEVHMLSHLVGASNRADIRRLSALEEQVAALEEKLAKQHRRHHQRLDEKNQEIDCLRAKLQAQSHLIEKIDGDTEPRQAPSPVPRDLTDELSELEATVTRYRTVIQKQNEEIERLSEQGDAMRHENKSLECALLRENAASETSSSFDLDGRCLLYVGGRQQTVHHLRALVEEWNGQLLHHDGGIERSLAGLAREVSKADAVVFPTDCVSHSAALKVKRLCCQTMKPFVPLRSSGIASFIAGLRSGLEAPMQSTVPPATW